MRAIWEGDQRTFSNGRVIIQPVEEQTINSNGILTTVKVRKCVHGDCGDAVEHLEDLYPCWIPECCRIVCWLCAAKCMLCSQTCCSLHCRGKSVEGVSLVVCDVCCKELET